MNTKPPPQRRKFAHEWDEIDHLYRKLLYWLYGREDIGKARPYADRLEKLLAVAAPHHDAIFGEECWSLVHEVKGDFAQAIQHRENEISLIRRLHEVCRSLPNKDVALEGYGYQNLSDRLDLLAGLYLDCDRLEEAVTLLQESQQLCRAHGIRYDGEDMLQECLTELGHTPLNGKRTERAATDRKVQS